MNISHVFHKKLEQMGLTCKFDPQYRTLRLYDATNLSAANIGKGFSSRDDGTCFVIGYSVRKEYQGKGLGALLLKYWMFLNNDLHRVHAMVECTNIASRKILESSGFQIVGQGENRMTYEYQDHAIGLERAA